MDSHDQDPTTDANAGADREDPWDEVSADFGDLKERLKDTYRRVADESGPSDEEIRQALTTLAGAWDQVAESVSTALQDPEVRAKLRTAASSFASAFGNTISELGSELRDGGTRATDEEE